MKIVTKAAVFAALCFALIACDPRVEQTEVPRLEPAETLFVNGQIYGDPAAEAVAVREGRIVAVGSDDVIKRLSDDATKIIDLEGGMLMPGFHDLHVHPLFGGMLYSGADYTNCQIQQGLSAEALSEVVAQCVARVKEGEWLTGGQWDAVALGDKLHKNTLDEISAVVPIILYDTSGHSGWANSAALKAAGVDATTSDPEGGIIERDANGEPTGILRESAVALVRGHAPPPSDKVLRAALEWSLDNMLSYGITSFTEASNGFVAGSEREVQLYADLADDGVLKQRVQVCLNWVSDSAVEDDDTEGVIANRRQYKRDRLKLDCIKIFLDGVPTDSHTAAMLEPYADTVAGRDDDASRYGLLLVEQEKLNEVVTQFDNMGMTVKFHAAGDAAVRAGLDAIEAARRANGDSGLRHNPGHCTFVAKEDLARAKALGATLELSPYLWSPSPINDDITKAIGAERIERVWPFREAIDSGSLIVAGSDWAVVPSANPWLAIESLVTREEPGGSENHFGKPQSISVTEAIDLFTVNAARHMGNEDSLGRIAEGMIADLIVVDRNPLETPANELHQTEVLLTMIEGEIVYQNSQPALTVDMFEGGFATVNSFVFSNGKSLVVMDVQRKTYEAEKLVELVKSKNLPVTHILITHGHTDHFTGMPLFRDEFPDAKIVVANEAIRKDIKAYAVYMNSGGETDAEPALEPPLIPKSEEKPDGFDYENTIQILPSNVLTLDGGGTLELTTDYLPTEADHMATVYSPDLNALFLSDLGYNKTHLWMGDDISWQDIDNWQQELARLKAEYADRNPIVYPGHGEVTDLSLFDEMIQYIDDYKRIAQSASSRDEAMAKMMAAYPDYGEADFFLKYSIENHVP